MIEPILLWSSLLFIFYAYLGYPLLLMALSAFRYRPVQRGNITPPVSFIITAYNEEKRIRKKIENTLKQDYPRQTLEIIVASDCSTDQTDDIVKSYESRGIRLVRAPERRGKEATQSLAVDAASGQFLLFSDVAALLLSDAVSTMMKNFCDPTVGCVSSVDRVIDPDGKITGEGAYVRYEMFLRNLETKVNGLVGLSGSFFGVRREVCKQWAVDLQSDFNTLLGAVKSGLRGVSDPECVTYYNNIVDQREEFDRKTRTVLRGLSVFMKSLPLLNALRYGLFSWQLFSHKLSRWLVPFAMIVAFFANAFLVPSSTLYAASFILQCGFYCMGSVGIWTDFFSRGYLIKIPSFFLLVNLSILNAWYRYLRGERLMSWAPSER